MLQYSECKKTFSNKSNLNRHLKLKHPSVDSDYEEDVDDEVMDQDDLESEIEESEDDEMDHISDLHNSDDLLWIHMYGGQALSNDFLISLSILKVKMQH